MKIVVAPDSYKGSLSAVEVAKAMECGIRKVFSDAQVCKVPIADGGEGTVEALVTSTQGVIRKLEVVGPREEKLTASWGILGDGKTAVIEMAAASGLPLVPPSRRDPTVTTTYGTGQLIKAALDEGAAKIIIGIGGSATNDGGMGMLQALGVKFLKANGQELPSGGGALVELATIDAMGLDARLAQTMIVVACDVDNPLFGPRGASYVYGPQKGADEKMVKHLEAALMNYAYIAHRTTGRDMANFPGAGAAGGLGAGFLFFTNAQLQPGIDIVLQAVGFADLVETASFVITGEGRTDEQTVFGKAPIGVAALAKRFNVPVICLSGGLDNGAEVVLEHGIDAIFSIVPRPITLDECKAKSTIFVQAAVEQICRSIAIGARLSKCDG